MTDFATDDQIQHAVKIYVDEMAARGHIQGLAHAEHLERVARIQDVWRVALERATTGNPHGLSGAALKMLVGDVRTLIDGFSRVYSGERLDLNSRHNYLEAVERLKEMLP